MIVLGGLQSFPIPHVTIDHHGNLDEESDLAAGVEEGETLSVLDRDGRHVWICLCLLKVDRMWCYHHDLSL